MNLFSELTLLIWFFRMNCFFFFASLHLSDRRPEVSGCRQRLAGEAEASVIHMDHMDHVGGEAGHRGPRAPHPGGGGGGSGGEGDASFLFFFLHPLWRKQRRKFRLAASSPPPALPPPSLSLPHSTPLPPSPPLPSSLSSSCSWSMACDRSPSLSVRAC